MIDTIYIEEDVRDHPRVRGILARHPQATHVVCERYGEVFNKRAQNFRLQKRRPALILARKFGRLVLPAPPGYGIGGARNFYFSHMLNCVYDCRYCFLQGMFQSAHYVVFVNYEDFAAAIDAALVPNEDTYFFSGYDCDSLVFEATTGFADFFLPFFEARPRAMLELRTKSVRVQPLLERDALPNVIVAFSMTPEPFGVALEHGVPPLHQRLDALERLAAAGWRVGLRFDPLLYHRNASQWYAQLFEAVFERVPADAVHSVSLGPLRFPKAVYEKIVKLYPDEPLFNAPMTPQDGTMSYDAAVETELYASCLEMLQRYVPAERLFSCFPVGAAS